MLYMDFETRSSVNLSSSSLISYASDLSTEVICLAYKIDDNEVKVWFADDSLEDVIGNKDKDLPADFLNYVLCTGGPIIAHNATFDRLIYEYVLTQDYDLPAPEISRWQCTQAQALASGLPGALASISKVLCLSSKKLAVGKRLLDTYSKPGYAERWQYDDKQSMKLYAAFDVLACSEVHASTRKLQPFELEQYTASEIMNDRGIPFDIDFSKAAVEYVEDIEIEANAGVVKYSSGRVQTIGERKARYAWLSDVLNTDQMDSLKKVKIKNGETTYSLSFDEDHRNKLRYAKNIPLAVANFIDVFNTAGGSATKKYAAVNRLHLGGRVYNTLLFNGAGTGRYSAIGGLQIQNFKRSKVDNAAQLMSDVKEGYALENPAKVLASLARSSITSPSGITFSDYDQIEARVLPWLYPCAGTDEVLENFRQGKDLYTTNAMKMFSLSEHGVTSELRQAAKVATLACQFGGSKGAVQVMCTAYGLSMTDDEADKVRNDWRAANPWAARLWQGLKDASHSAVHAPGEKKFCGRIFFIKHGDFLYMGLPSGRYIAYCQPRLEEVEVGSPAHDYHFTTQELTAISPHVKPAAGVKEWPRRTINFLKLVENATQAVAADVLREAVVNVVNAGLPIIFSVHDEIVVEGDYVDALTKEMEKPPSWAEGLPITAGTKFSDRYGK